MPLPVLRSRADGRSICRNPSRETHRACGRRIRCRRHRWRRPATKYVVAGGAAPQRLADVLSAATVSVEGVQFAVERADVDHAVDDGGRGEIHEVAHASLPRQREADCVALVDRVFESVDAGTRRRILERWPVGLDQECGRGGKSAGEAAGLYVVRSRLRRFCDGTSRVKLPELSAVAEPEAAASNVMVTVSPEENPEPVAVVFVVGGPDFGEREIDAVAAKLAAEKVPASRRPRSIIRTSMI